MGDEQLDQLSRVLSNSSGGVLSKLTYQTEFLVKVDYAGPERTGPSSRPSQEEGSGEPD